MDQQREATRPGIPLAQAHLYVGKALFRTDWLPVPRGHLEQFDRSIGATPEETDLSISAANPLGGDLINGIWLLARAVTVFFDHSPIREPGMWAFNYGYEKVRFLSPVLIGKRVRYTAVLDEVREHPLGRLLVTTNTVEVEGSDKPAAVFTSMALASTRPPAALTGG